MILVYPRAGSVVASSNLLPLGGITRQDRTGQDISITSGCPDTAARCRAVQPRGWRASTSTWPEWGSLDTCYWSPGQSGGAWPPAGGPPSSQPGRACHCPWPWPGHRHTAPGRRPGGPRLDTAWQGVDSGNWKVLVLVLQGTLQLKEGLTGSGLMEMEAAGTVWLSELG